ncbi:MAG: alpha/beta fold hydrolase, partial [Chloroflexi bacterium]
MNMNIWGSAGSKKRYWRNLFGFLLVCVVVGWLFVQYGYGPYALAYAHAHPNRQPVCCETPADYGFAYEDVAVETADNLTLHGWYIPSTNGAAVIALHGINSNRVSMLEPAVLLAEHGYGVFLLDLRAHGESEGDVLPFGGPEGEDVRATAVFLQSRDDVDPDRIGVIGWSLGAQTAVIAAAQHPEIKAIIADGPGATTFEDWPPPRTLDEWLFRPFDFVYYKF